MARRYASRFRFPLGRDSDDRVDLRVPFSLASSLSHLVPLVHSNPKHARNYAHCTRYWVERSTPLPPPFNPNSPSFSSPRDSIPLSLLSKVGLNEVYAPHTSKRSTHTHTHTQTYTHVMVYRYNV